MEKRIKIIWILSLLSALLLIGVQGYWLYNQFAYVMQHYSEEQAAAILRAGDEEYAIRKKEVPDNILYVINRNTEYSRTAGRQDTQQQQISMQFSVKDSIPAQLNQMHLHFNPRMSEDSLYASIDKAIIHTHALSAPKNGFHLTRLAGKHSLRNLAFSRKRYDLHGFLLAEVRQYIPLRNQSSLYLQPYGA